MSNLISEATPNAAVVVDTDVMFTANGVVVNDDELKVVSPVEKVVVNNSLDVAAEPTTVKVVEDEDPACLNKKRSIDEVSATEADVVESATKKISEDQSATTNCVYAFVTKISQENEVPQSVVDAELGLVQQTVPNEKCEKTPEPAVSEVVPN